MFKTVLLKTIRFILSLLFNIVAIALLAVACVSIVYNILPEIDKTFIGEFLNAHVTLKTIRLVTICSIVGYFLVYALRKILNKPFSSKYSNTFTHISSWFSMLIVVALTMTVFVLTSEFSTLVNMSVARKIAIGVVLAILVIYHLLSNIISKLVNRKIQSYDTAKEISAVGRSSIIWVNFLKLAELLLPEFLILGLVCCCVDIAVAKFFLIILISSFLPVVGNIICDINARKEAITIQEKERAELVNTIAEKINNKKEKQSKR